MCQIIHYGLVCDGDYSKSRAAYGEVGPPDPKHGDVILYDIIVYTEKCDRHPNCNRKTETNTEIRYEDFCLGLEDAAFNAAYPGLVQTAFEQVEPQALLIDALSICPFCED